MSGFEPGTQAQQTPGPARLKKTVPNKIHNLCLAIREDGLNFEKDGREIIQTLTLIANFYYPEEFRAAVAAPEDREALDALIPPMIADLLELDEHYKWDHKDKSEALEDRILGLFVIMWSVSIIKVSGKSARDLVHSHQL